MTSTDRRRPAPASTPRPDLEAYRRALDLADGDRSRLVVEDGGRTIRVLNAPAR